MERRNFTKIVNGYRWVLSERHGIFRAHARKMIPDGKGHSYSRHVGIAVCFHNEQKRAEFVKSTDIEAFVIRVSNGLGDLLTSQQVWIFM